jgi:hypothetical protein
MHVPACFKTSCTRDEAYASINELNKHQGKTLGELGVLDEAYKDRVVPDAKYRSNARKQAAAHDRRQPRQELGARTCGCAVTSGRFLRVLSNYLGLRGSFPTS